MFHGEKIIQNTPRWRKKLTADITASLSSQQRKTHIIFIPHLCWEVFDCVLTSGFKGQDFRYLEKGMLKVLLEITKASANFILYTKMTKYWLYWCAVFRQLHLFWNDSWSTSYQLEQFYKWMCGTCEPDPVSINIQYYEGCVSQVPFFCRHFNSLVWLVNNTNTTSSSPSSSSQS